MGRHRSTLRDLGWAASNSPNPWKQGSAKRVVRTLDFQAEADECAPASSAANHGGEPAKETCVDDRINHIQQDGEQLLHSLLLQMPVAYSNSSAWMPS